MSTTPSKWKELDSETKKTVLEAYDKILASDILYGCHITEDVKEFTRLCKEAIVTNNIEMQGELGILILKRDCLHIA